MILLQLIIVKFDNPPVLNSPEWDSARTKQTFMNLCADCHSNETVYPWYSYIPPVSFLIYTDVANGRKHFNISEYTKEDGVKSAYEYKKGEMPLWIYTLMHRDAILDENSKAEFIEGLEATFGKYEREELEKNYYNHPTE